MVRGLLLGALVPEAPGGGSGDVLSETVTWLGSVTVQPVDKRRVGNGGLPLRQWIMSRLPKMWESGSTSLAVHQIHPKKSKGDRCEDSGTRLW